MMTIAITVDRKWGGFYCHGLDREKHVSARLCIGFVALDLFYISIDDVFAAALNEIDRLQASQSVEVNSDPA
jgi:hypothetical protein